MSSTAEHSITNDKFLTMSCNLLAKSFFDSTRTESKGYYRAINDGKRLALSRVVMDDESTIDVVLTLNCSEYCGRISFSHFREQLRLLLQRFSDALQKGEELPVLQEEGGVASVFKMPVLHQANDQVNALVLGWATPVPGQLELRLMYLDPEQFKTDSAASA
ncbi:MAG: hypothetical protein AB8B86_06020 [Pseudomonadales bacterium]